MGYEHLNITPEMESDEVTESNAENLLPILSECEVALEDKRECTVPIFENFPDCDNHSEILFDSNNDDLSSDDKSFADIEYVDASVPDPAIVRVEEENTRSGNTTHANYSLPEYDSFCFEIEPDQERLINLIQNDNSDSSNDPLLVEVDLFLFDDSISPGREINVSTKIEDDDYFLFMFVIRFLLPYFIFPEVSPLLLSAECEDTIFDPGISD
nr:hypothetical protein [Tanacetum cinerariifolium]